MSTCPISYNNAPGIHYHCCLFYGIIYTVLCIQVVFVCDGENVFFTDVRFYTNVIFVSSSPLLFKHQCESINFVNI